MAKRVTYLDCLKCDKEQLDGFRIRVDDDGKPFFVCARCGEKYMLAGKSGTWRLKKL